MTPIWTKIIYGEEWGIGNREHVLKMKQKTSLACFFILFRFLVQLNRSKIIEYSFA